ncbi:MAG TPA: proline dehydrogenase family protein [Chthonomonadales bacterium]|nr:proline dehydrogenase family protein [Chthonomonadales bacterium]
MITRAVLLRLGESKRVEGLIRNSAWSSRAARRFVAGETIDEALRAARTLNGQSMPVTLDYLGESVRAADQVAAVMEVYHELFRRIREDGLDANVSLKLTALGLDIDPAHCLANMRRLLDAVGADQFVRIDMEGSSYTQRTLDLFYTLWNENRRNVGVVIQSYLRRSATDVEGLLSAGARVRLCKGAYNEPPEVAFPEKSQVDENYIRLMRRLLVAGVYPGIATHDEKMIAATRSFACEQKIATDRFEFQMLYGIRKDIQAKLVSDGYRLRIYTPFGTHWYPYFMRRLAERPANLWFVVKNVLRG